MDTLEHILPEEGTRQHFEILTELGQCHVSIGNFDRAKECFEHAAQLDGDAAEPYLGLGVVAMQNSQLDEAEISFKVARRLNPKNPKTYCGLGMIYQQKGSLAESFDNYLKSLELDSDNLTALLGLFQASCQMGSFGKVIYYLETYLRSHPDDVSVMFSLGSLYAKDGRLEQARDTLSKVVAYDPENKDAANVLEEIEHRLKNLN